MLEFIKKNVSFDAFSEALIHNHIAAVLVLGSQHRTLLSNFFTKQYLLLNFNLTSFLNKK